ncbi:rhomboid family intramembrane serine protease [Heyndrickxia acidiproducens]|jgi:membrane associated rhomboid family serine protease|uniref:rhomboid family intramembrane serine protease n=1 Tax=Heyndrickxia acidiproducens TaxID=1121084 RepID=UPI00036114A5|nr:rhomboid family intramembrane serine protease [Heyndrickxia acidiproducens]
MFIRPVRLSALIQYYPVAFAIVFIQCVLFMVMQLPFFPNQGIYQGLTGVNLYIAQGEVWRLISPVFVHIHFSHLLLNSFSILLLGPFLEHYFGKWKFSILYFGSGIIANGMTFLLLPLTYHHAGASGAIFGLLGCYLAFLYVFKQSMPKTRQQTILIVISFTMLTALLQPGTNTVAHLSGFIGGVALGLLILKLKKGTASLLK